MQEDDFNWGGHGGGGGGGDSFYDTMTWETRSVLRGPPSFICTYKWYSVYVCFFLVFSNLRMAEIVRSAVAGMVRVMCRS